jgi:pilus assembly protein CpaB
MRPKSLILLSLALGCGLVAALGINQMMAKQGPITITSGEAREIYVTLKDINTNDLVVTEALKLEPWPKDKVPPDAIEKLEDIVGRRARTKLFAGEPVRDAKLLEKGDAGLGAADSIPDGFRVVSVKVDAVKSGGNLIKPGDRVDVIVHIGQGAQAADAVSKIFLQDVRVFAVNDLIDRDNNGASKIAAQTIGLLVKPEQVELITLAEEMGKIRLSMRSPNDDAKLTTEGAMKSNLLGDNRNANSRSEESQLKPGSQPKNPLLEMLNGMKPAVGPQATNDETPPFRMKIIRGPDVEEVELDPSGKAVVGAGKSAKSGTSATPGTPKLPLEPQEPAEQGNSGEDQAK